MPALSPPIALASSPPPPRRCILETGWCLTSMALRHPLQRELGGAMAARDVSRRQLGERGCLGSAALDGIGAARMEIAPVGRVRGVGDLALQNDPLCPQPRIGFRHSGEQRL